MLIFKFFSFKTLVASLAPIPFKSGTVVEVATASLEYNIITEDFESAIPGFGFCSETSSVFTSPEHVTFTLNPASSNVFCASAIVLSFMFGTVIKFSLLELSVFVDSEGTFKYGNISESI